MAALLKRPPAPFRIDAHGKRYIPAVTLLIAFDEKSTSKVNSVRQKYGGNPWNYFSLIYSLPEMETHEIVQDLQKIAAHQNRFSVKVRDPFSSIYRNGPNILVQPFNVKLRLYSPVMSTLHRHVRSTLGRRNMVAGFLSKPLNDTPNVPIHDENTSYLVRVAPASSADADRIVREIKSEPWIKDWSQANDLIATGFALRELPTKADLRMGYCPNVPFLEIPFTGLPHCSSSLHPNART